MATPLVELSHLDHLWFQVSGTRCNLTCTHCFISCSPKNDSFGYLTVDQVRRSLQESVALGVKEYYFTGGEPFLHPDMVAILIETLKYGPATVLTNGTVLKESWLTQLAAAEERSRYSLEFRVSIDGFSPETNDPIRGEGTFDRAVQGIVKLARAGFLPIITAARTWPEDQDVEIVRQYVEMLAAAGCDRPRLKILPTLRIGAEAERTHGYSALDRVDESMLAGYDRSQLICEHSRIVTDRGVYVCPILIESADARISSDSLTDALTPFEIGHGACFTCYQYGAICSNPSSQSSNQRT